MKYKEKRICNSMQCDAFHVISTVTTEMNFIRPYSKRRHLLFWNVTQH